MQQICRSDARSWQGSSSSPRGSTSIDCLWLLAEARPHISPQAAEHKADVECCCVSCDNAAAYWALHAGQHDRV